MRLIAFGVFSLEKMEKTDVFLGGDSRNLGNTAWAAMAGLGSNGLS